MTKCLKLFVLFALSLVTHGVSSADDTDRGRMWLSYNYKVDTPINYFVQYYETESEFFSIRDMNANPQLLSKSPTILSIRNRDKFFARMEEVSKKSPSSVSRRCDENKVMEVRFIDPVWLACEKVVPLDGETIEYNAIENESALNALMSKGKGNKWRRVKTPQEADIALFVELEISNVVNFDRNENLAFTSVATIKNTTNYKPRYILGLNITGLNLDQNVENKIVFKMRMNEFFIDTPSEETINSLMSSVGEKIRKQRNFGNKKSDRLRFTNFEGADK